MPWIRIVINDIGNHYNFALNHTSVSAAIAHTKGYHWSKFYWPLRVKWSTVNPSKMIPGIVTRPLRHLMTVVREQGEVPPIVNPQFGAFIDHTQHTLRGLTPNSENLHGWVQ